MTSTFKLSPNGPYAVSLRIGRFPYRWKLFDYVQQTSGEWRYTLLQEADGAGFVTLPFHTSAEAKGHRLLWSATVINADTDPQDVDVQAVLRQSPATAGDSINETWSADPKKPALYVSVALD